MLQDVRYAIRGFVAQPGFTLAAVLSLAIGIGANAALFSVTSALLLRPLPYKNADRLVILWQRSPGLNIAEDWFSTAQYFDIKNGHSWIRAGRDCHRRQLRADRARRSGTDWRDSRVVESAPDARRAARGWAPFHTRRRFAGPGVRRRARPRHVGAAVWTGSAHRRHVDHVERRTVPDRRRPAGALLAAA